MPMIGGLGGGWNGMTTAQQIAWAGTCAGLGLTVFIKAAQGIWRLASFWSDLGSFIDTLKAFFRFQQVLKDLPETADAVNDPPNR
jgi:hypothetical protein